MLVGLLLLAVSPVALAQQHDVERAGSGRAAVAMGQDLVAWQTLEQRRMVGPAAIEAYKAFALRFSDSPLAVMAFGRLMDLRAPFELWMEDPELKTAFAPIRRTWEQTQRALAASAPRRGVAMMDMGDAIAEEAEDTGR